MSDSNHCTSLGVASTMTGCIFVHNIVCIFVHNYVVCMRTWSVLLSILLSILLIGLFIFKRVKPMWFARITRRGEQSARGTGNTNPADQVKGICRMLDGVHVLWPPGVHGLCTTIIFYYLW